MSALISVFANHRFTPFLGLFFIFLLAAALYGSLSQHSFLFWDDRDYILSNYMLRPLSVDNLVAMFTQVHSANWHPMTWLSYAINFAIWGESASAIKWTNFTIHIINSFLVFLLTVMFLKKIEQPDCTQQNLINAFSTSNYFIPGLIAALLFAIAPHHVEPVAWISDRKDILCTLFYLAAFSCYLYSRGSDREKTWDHLVLVLFLFALMSKPIAVTLPVVLMFVDAYILKRVKFDNKQKLAALIELVRSKLAMIFLSACVSVITLITQSSQIQGIEDFSLFSRIANISINYFYYFTSIIFADSVSPYHPILPIVKNPGLLSILPAIAFMGLIAILAVKHKKIDKLIVLCFALYTIMVIPAIGLVQLAFAAKADRYSYLPSFIFYILIANYLYLYFIKYKSNILVSTGFSAAGICLLAYLSTTTYQYVNDWTDDESLWQRVARLYPDTGSFAYNNLGYIYNERQEYQQAIEYYKKAIETNPKEILAYRNITNAYLRVRDFDSVMKYYHLLIENNPDEPVAYELLGDHYYRNGKLEKADKLYKTMLKIAPSNPNAIMRNALMDIARKDYQSALQRIDYYLILKPNQKQALDLKEKVLRDMSSSIPSTAKTTSASDKTTIE